MSTAISIRLPEHLASRLDDIAQETERSRSFIIQKALESYIEDFADRVGDYRVIYALLGPDILILRIANRKDVYKGEP